MEGKSRSVKIKKIETVYHKYLTKFKDSDNTDSKDIQTTNISIKKPLNTYQKFVQNQSKKEEYRSLPVRQRFMKIGEDWSNKKK